MTAIEAAADRPDGSGCDGDRAIDLPSAQKQFFRLSKKLDREIERLERLNAVAAGSEVRDLSNLIRDTQRALATVLDFQSKLDDREQGGAHALDLEAARDEIISRLARLAERGGAGGIS